MKKKPITFTLLLTAALTMCTCDFATAQIAMWSPANPATTQSASNQSTYGQTQIQSSTQIPIGQSNDNPFIQAPNYVAPTNPGMNNSQYVSPSEMRRQTSETQYRYENPNGSNTRTAPAPSIAPNQNFADSVPQLPQSTFAPSSQIAPGPQGAIQVAPPQTAPRSIPVFVPERSVCPTSRGSLDRAPAFAAIGAEPDCLYERERLRRAYLELEMERVYYAPSRYVPYGGRGLDDHAHGYDNHDEYLDHERSRSYRSYRPYSNRNSY